MDRRERGWDEERLAQAIPIPMTFASFVAHDRLTGAFARGVARSTGPIAPDGVLEFTERMWWYAEQLTRVLPWLKGRAEGARDPRASHAARRLLRSGRDRVWLFADPASWSVRRWGA